MKFSRILKISRPRLWLYELGAYSLGTVSAYIAIYTGTIPATEPISLVQVELALLFFIYFAFPANLLLYGVNDIFDHEIDAKNPKKVSAGAVLEKESHHEVWRWIIWTNIFFVIALLAYLAVTTTKLNSPLFISFCAFIFFATFYSAKPIRARTRPILDSIFYGAHYIATAVFAFFLLVDIPLPTRPDVLSLAQIDWRYVFAGIAWVVATHAYAAVSDMRVDIDSGIRTTATFLKEKKTIVLCFVLYAISAFTIFDIYSGLRNSIIALLVVPFLILMIISYFTSGIKDQKIKESKLNSQYKFFQGLNVMAVFLLFWVIYLIHLM